MTTLLPGRSAAPPPPAPPPVRRSGDGSVHCTYCGSQLITKGRSWVHADNGEPLRNECNVCNWQGSALAIHIECPKCGSKAPMTRHFANPNPQEVL